MKFTVSELYKLPIYDFIYTFVDRKDNILFSDWTVKTTEEMDDFIEKYGKTEIESIVPSDIEELYITLKVGD